MYLEKEYENWNVECKKPILVHNELSNLDFDVVALQETQLESGIKKIGNFALFNSKLECKKHEFGCGF